MNLPPALWDKLPALAGNRPVSEYVKELLESQEADKDRV